MVVVCYFALYTKKTQRRSDYGCKKFGVFIATLRKENNMIQVDLARKLLVTDKAVSKWERGLGFPDIKPIEPLADALGGEVY